MAKNIFVINIGSESKKYALYRGEERVFSARVEKEEGVLRALASGNPEKQIELADYNRSFNEVLGLLEEFGLVKNVDEDIFAVGIRIVAPGKYFAVHRIIDMNFMAKLEFAAKTEPLHIRPVLSELREIMDFRSWPVCGISDSAFNATVSEEARVYGIALAEAAEFQRFGYHGLSAASVVGKLPSLFGAVPKKAILCHLGGGTSMFALSEGKSIDMSMGYTPLEGLIMATRPGDMDAGVVLNLVERFGDVEKTRAYLYDSCGLLGLSGFSGSVKDILDAEAKGNAKAVAALKAYIHRIVRYAGGYAAILGGLDALIFSGTVGERSFLLRERICKKLEFFGIRLDPKKNGREIESKPEFIHSKESKVAVSVVPTDEMGEIAKETAALSLAI